jgi:hypothetical protein
MTDLAQPAAPLELLAYRGIDTIIGVGAAILVALIIKDRTTGPHPDQG